MEVSLAATSDPLARAVAVSPSDSFIVVVCSVLKIERDKKYGRGGWMVLVGRAIVKMKRN